MMALDTGRMRDALRPLHAELLRRARAEADQILADANADARDVLDGAEKEAHRIIDSARAAGAAEALMAQDAERARTRRAHQRGVLAARRNGYEQLRARATDAVHELRGEPGYPALRERLAARAVQVLGTGVIVTDAPAGGIVAEAAGRRLDLSLTAFAERALERAEADIDGLWS